jgi:polysaccharide biosynthesis protein PslH
VKKRDRLRLLFLSPYPPSPASFGAQRRIQGLVASMARRHDVSIVALVGSEHDVSTVRRAVSAYCDDVCLVPTISHEGFSKRWRQLASLASPRSFVRGQFDSVPLRNVLRDRMTAVAYDVVSVEFPFLALTRLDWSPPGAPRPLLVLDEHNIEFDLSLQQERAEEGLARTLYNRVNGQKVRREEVEAWRRFDGVAFCSGADQSRARQIVPALRSVVAPNAVDLDYFRPGPSDPPPDGRTALFFGAINYFPNVDGLLFLLREVWPLLLRSHPSARLKIVGQHPTPEILAFRGSGVEITGRVEDIRPHLAGAALTIAPLRMGGGTRLKVLEAMAMAKAVVSTPLGAEGILAEPGRHLLLAEDAPGLAAAIGRILDDPGLGARIGAAGRRLVEDRYSWDASALAMEGLYHELLSAPGSAHPPRSRP